MQSDAFLFESGILTRIRKTGDPLISVVMDVAGPAQVDVNTKPENRGGGGEGKAGRFVWRKQSRVAPNGRVVCME